METLMYQAPLPLEYAELSDAELDRRIVNARATLGRRLVVLGHHYQRDGIVKHADYLGDSYKLAKDAAKHPEAEFIVFCGVHFMAESADILTPPTQTVILPNLAAGCSMADMANLYQVRSCWKSLGGIFEGLCEPQHSVVVRDQSPRIAPITYINSAASLKAFVGEHGGTVCTSSNAPVAVQWALNRADKVLFFPDQHLGRNTGVKLGFDPDRDMCLWDPAKPLGGNDAETLRRATFLLWKGHCSVHQRFTVEQIVHARSDHAGCQVIVHPECPLEVVQAADYSGSTETIIQIINEAPPGTTWAVGTEINLVSRLAKQMPDKSIFCLDPQVCPCSTMYRIHPSFLCWVLESLVAGEVMNEIRVPSPTKEFARLALDRMLTLV
jgi:quinolinate synthase